MRTTHEEDVDTEVNAASFLEGNTDRRDENGKADKK